jgi:hypothetical protein
MTIMSRAQLGREGEFTRTVPSLGLFGEFCER